MRSPNIFKAAATVVALGTCFAVHAQLLEPEAQAFSFQARLSGPGIPQNGTVDLTINIYDVAVGGGAVSGPHNLPGEPIANNVVSVTVPGINVSAFDGGKLWVGVGVNAGAELTPRVPLIAVPYALRVHRVGNTELDDDLILGDGVTSGSLQIYDDQGATAVALFGQPGAGNPHVDVSGTVRMTGFVMTNATGAGLVLTSDANGVGTWQALPPAGGGWSLTGNAGTDPLTNFLGTTDDVPLELRVNGGRALRLEPDATSPNLIGGVANNAVTSGAVGATIAGGGAVPDIFNNPRLNKITDNFGAIGGGRNNLAGNDDPDPENAENATVAGGVTNQATAQAATVGGGDFNTAGATWATVAGGTSNTADAAAATVAGGYANSASADGATIGGGRSNTASGADSTVPGGTSNTATGAGSFAAGSNAAADHDGTFVWADSDAAPFQSTSPNQFLIRASGGVGIGTDAPGATLHIGGTPGVDGLMFPDGSLQTTAATGGGGGHWSANGDHIYNSNAGNVGIGITSPVHPLHVVAPGARAVQGHVTDTTGQTYGVFGQSDSDEGQGLRGWATAATGATYGVLGKSESTAGVGVGGVSPFTGVHGISSGLTGNAAGVVGETLSTTGSGVLGISDATSGVNHGVFGQSSSTQGRGVYGLVGSGTGINYGVYGESTSSGGTGVLGTAPAAGVLGRSTATTGSARGGYFEVNSDEGIGVAAAAMNPSGVTYGVWGQSLSDSGVGVMAYASSLAGQTYGVYAQSDSTDGRGVHAVATATSGNTYGVYGESRTSIDGAGVFGKATADFGVAHGVKGETASTNGSGTYGLATAIWGGRGVTGWSQSEDYGRGVFGLSSASAGPSYGVYGESSSTQGVAVYGDATSASGDTVGVYGQVASPDGRGVYGLATDATGQAAGVFGESASDYGRGVYGLATAEDGATGVYGKATGDHGRAIFGEATGAGLLGRPYGVYGIAFSALNGVGVYGVAPTSGVRGAAAAPTGWAVGVFGSTDSADGRGVYGDAANTGANYGVYGRANIVNGFGVYAEGNMGCSGNKPFRIDHPMDPANKYLFHYSAEGPEPLLIYRGNVVLDGNGETWVDLPEYFEEINRDYHYQLTPIGSAGPNLHIAQEIEGNRFKIAGGRPGLKVSWTVTGVRNDAFVRTVGAPVEKDKPEYERGKYQHPELYGMPPEMGVSYDPTREQRPKLLKEGTPDDSGE